MSDLALQRPPVEQRYAEELEQLAAKDRKSVKPPGWNLSPLAVIDFILGDKRQNISPKFVGRRRFVERCVATLATNRGLMLIGPPGSAKSYLSELLAAAISGDSGLTIQGSAGTTEDQIKYTWNYALLLEKGPGPESLVPAPVYQGMQQGKLVRFEEITRCPLEIQDTLLSILSDRVLHIPELEQGASAVYARQGFNLIATANTLDKGVNEMSAALKRRLNFETVQPIASIEEEVALVARETDALLQHAGIPMTLPVDKAEVLVTVFHELRNAKVIGGGALEPLNSVMSTAESVSVAFAACVQGYYYNQGALTAEHLVSALGSTAAKDSSEDLKKIRHYLHHVAGKRKGAAWTEFANAKQALSDY
ncbi:MoxR-like ATPase [Hahella chejuensis KCTC 2396]|uniref:MoxR-like ATPase n=1 Tax=Hahella chejuensis (strain KCTC 2396) TaxID=349521 RepID=Q2SH03_HAHCH|nr:AAA family ATPase [Hahella chejuensis]ABC30071.1 MoxR-like ATPase [Hahella chejuensis KCTC 2396]